MSPNAVIIIVELASRAAMSGEAGNPSGGRASVVAIVHSVPVGILLRAGAAGGISRFAWRRCRTGIVTVIDAITITIPL